MEGAGPVWRLRTELAEWDPTHGTWQAARGVSAVTFRRDGQISDGESHYSNGSVARWARLYDDGGRMIERPGIRGIHYSVEGSEFAYSAPGAATLTVTYGDRELPAAASFHDAHGGVIRRIVFSRDSDGHVLSEVVHFSGEDPFARSTVDTDDNLPEEWAKTAALLKSVFAGQVLSSMAYAYDSKGRLVERTVRVGVLVTERTTFQYDDSTTRLPRLRRAAAATSAWMMRQHHASKEKKLVFDTVDSTISTTRTETGSSGSPGAGQSLSRISRARASNGG